MVSKTLPALGLFLFVVGAAADVTPERQHQLLYLLRHDCGSCHGLTLKGGLGPPLLPQDLANRSAMGLGRTILEGTPGTPMPPWRGILAEDEVRWLVEQLQKGIDDGD
jgi:cytochrome c55X